MRSTPQQTIALMLYIIIHQKRHVRLACPTTTKTSRPTRSWIRSCQLSYNMYNYFESQNLLGSCPLRPSDEGLYKRGEVVQLELVLALEFALSAGDEDTLMSSLVTRLSGGDATAQNKR